MVGEQVATKIAAVPLSTDTVRRVIDMGEDSEQHRKEDVLKSPQFAMQIDDSTDVSNNAVLLIFIRYRGKENILEDMLTCEELTGRTTVQKIFNKGRVHRRQRVHLGKLRRRLY